MAQDNIDQPEAPIDEPAAESPGPEPIAPPPAEPADSPQAEAGQDFDADIEALLRHAEALTEVISTADGDSIEEILDTIADDGPIQTDSQPVESVSEPQASEVESAVDEPVVETESSPTPMPAPDPTIEESEEINSILNEVEAQLEEEESNTNATGSQLPDLLNDPDQQQEIPADTAAIESPSTAEVLYIPDEDETPESPEGVAEDEQCSEEEAAEESPQTDALEDEPTAADDESSPSTNLISEDIDETESDSIIDKCLNAARSALDFAGGVKQGFQQSPRRAVAVLAVVLDHANAPFARFDEKSRSLLGIVAVATLFGAILSWVLPWLLITNPFEQIPLGIVTDR